MKKAIYNPFWEKLSNEHKRKLQHTPSNFKEAVKNLARSNNTTKFKPKVDKRKTNKNLFSILKIES
jgi:proline dehydrogenase